MRYPVIPRHTKNARVEEISGESGRYLLSIPAGEAGKYRLAQLDDYAKLKRGSFPLLPPLRLTLSARTSNNTIPGTWGFGFWNDPFGMALGFGGNPSRFPTLPNAAWFFGASKESYLSFRESRAPEEHRDYRSEGAANGFLAQTFRSPKFDLRLIPAGLLLPFSRRRTRQTLGKIIDEDGINLATEITQWHKYRIDWRAQQVSFTVDDEPVFETAVSPRPPLGLVIWIDNQYAAFTPEGKIGFGVLENPEPAWLEIKEIDIR